MTDPIRTVDDATLDRWSRAAWTDAARATAEARRAAAEARRTLTVQDAHWAEMAEREAVSIDAYWHHLRNEADRRAAAAEPTP